MNSNLTAHWFGLEAIKDTFGESSEAELLGLGNATEKWTASTSSALSSEQKKADRSKFRATSHESKPIHA